MVAVKIRWATVLAVCCHFMVACSIIATGFIGDPVHAESVSPEEVQQEDLSLDAVSYCELRTIRQELRLTDQDLASIGCDGDDADAALRALRGWYESNRAEYRTRIRAVVDAKREVRATRITVATDVIPQAVSEAPTATRTVVSDALQARQALVEKAITIIEAALDESQRSIWKIARENSASPEGYQYVPALSADQKDQLRRAQRARTRQRLVGSPPSAPDLAATEATVLSVAQIGALAEARRKASVNLRAMQAASAKILPVPAAMRATRRPERNAEE